GRGDLAGGRAEGELHARPPHLASPVLRRLVRAGQPRLEAVGQEAPRRARRRRLRGLAVLAGQEIADGPDAVLAVQQRALPGAAGHGGGGLVPGEGAGGRQRGGRVDAVDGGAPPHGAVLTGGADQLLLDADVRRPRLRGGEG